MPIENYGRVLDLVDPPVRTMAPMTSTKVRSNTEPAEPAEKVDVVEMVALWAACSSLIAIALLVLGLFTPIVVPFVGAALAILVVRVARIEFHQPRIQPTALGLAAVVSGLALRWGAYPHLMGGQDPGLYTNMAVQMRRTGSLTFTDRFRQTLSGGLLEIYDRSAISSVSFVDRAHSVMTVDFYPLHPAWMAIAGSIAGVQHQTISLLFFAWFGIVMAMGVVRQVFPDSNAAPLAALFLALNPALAFFSKFPVTEIVASAFAFAGFNFLLKACAAVHRRPRNFHAMVSVLSFSSLCFVRFQLVMYLPFLVLIAAAAFIRFVPATARNTVFGIVGATISVFGLSMLFYRTQQRRLFDLATSNFAPLGRPAVMAAALVALMALVVGYRIVAYRKGEDIIRRFAERLLRASPWLLCAALLLSAVSIFQLYRTGVMPPWGYRVPIDDVFLIRYSALFRLALFATPVALCVVVSFVAWRDRPKLVNAATLLLAVCWTAMLFQPYVPYLYYYGRYLVADTLPLTIALAAIGISRLAQSGRVALYRVLVVAVVAMMLPFSALQLGRTEGDDAAFARDVGSELQRNDVFVIAASNDSIYASLRIAFDDNVMVLQDGQTAGEFYGFLLRDLAQATWQRGGRLVLALPQQSSAPGLLPIAETHFQVGYLTNGEHWRDGSAFHSDSAENMLLPVAFRSSRQAWFLYEVQSAYFSTLNCDTPGQLEETDRALGTWGFWPAEVGGRWTTQSAAFRCDVGDESAPKMVAIRISRAFASSERPQRLSVRVNGVERIAITARADGPVPDIMVPIPPSPMQLTTVDVELVAPDAVSPAEIGAGSDARTLGFFIQSITVTN